MTITSFYYLQYPDCSPKDPTFAASEVYVEVANGAGDTEHFDSTYALTICTTGFLKHHLESNAFYAGRSLIIVERFEDPTIKRALESILPKISEIALKK